MPNVPLTGISSTTEVGTLLVWTLTPPGPGGGWTPTPAGAAGGWTPITSPETYFLIDLSGGVTSLDVLPAEGSETSTQFMVYSAGDNWTPVVT